MVEFRHTVDKALRWEASLHLRDAPNIRRALLWIKQNPNDFATRVSEFDQTCHFLNGMLHPRVELNRLDPRYYRDVLELREMRQGMPLTKLRDHLYITYGLANFNRPSGQIKRHGDTTFEKSVEETFDEIRQLIERGGWPFVTDTNTPNRIASGMLVEGYPIFANYNSLLSVNRRTFVLAFEVVLLRNFPESELLKDILPWMIEERNDFPADIAKDLEKRVNQV